MKRYKRYKDYGFFDQDFRLSKLSDLGNPLEKLKSEIDFEYFRDLLEDKLHIAPKGKGGRPPYDYVLMFKILILQRYYGLSDAQIEYQINDRLSFMAFLDLTISDDIPDSKTIWSFVEKLKDLDLVKELFDLFSKELNRLNLIVNEGKIIDASFVESPRQRNTKEENKHIKETGETPEEWEDNHKKKAQKDIDARWSKKGAQNFYGYKNHAKVDSKSKLIDGYLVTSANVHDSQALNDLLNENDKNQELYADSAYVGQEEILEKYEVINKVHEKGYKNSPLTEEQIKLNNEKSKIRVRVEHVFGFMENSMSMEFSKIGIRRAEVMIGLMNLTYNMFRKIQLTK